jgi:ABC-type transport system involved in multi-copper enzyme maturation permease subunit
MRGPRAFIALTVALVLLAVFSFTLYRMVIASSRYSYTPLSPQIGQALFIGLTLLELMIISTVTPAITAGAISSEKERQTYEMLLVTPLHPVNILWGKLISALSYILLLVFVAVPISSLIFIFGGVTLRDILKTIAILTIITVMFGVVGLFMSALFGRTGRATAASYLVVMGLLFGPIFMAAVAGIFIQSEPPRWLLVLSPVSALVSAFSSSANPQSISSVSDLVGYSLKWMWGSPAISLTEIPRPLYHYSLPVFAAATFILYIITTRLVRLSNRWKIEWCEALVIFIILVGIIGLVFLAYLATTNSYENFLQHSR